MDSGWAVVLGAAIALIGSAVIPWIREAATRKQISAHETQSAVSRATLAVIREGARFHAGNSQIGRREFVIARFRMLVPAEDRDISKLVELAFTSISDPDRDIRGTAYVAMADMLPAWFRHEQKASQLLSDFQREMKDAAELSRIRDTASPE